MTDLCSLHFCACVCGHCYFMHILLSSLDGAECSWRDGLKGIEKSYRRVNRTEITTTFTYKLPEQHDAIQQYNVNELSVCVCIYDIFLFFLWKSLRLKKAFKFVLFATTVKTIRNLFIYFHLCSSFCWYGLRPFSAFLKNDVIKIKKVSRINKLYICKDSFITKFVTGYWTWNKAFHRTELMIHSTMRKCVVIPY